MRSSWFQADGDKFSLSSTGGCGGKQKATDFVFSIRKCILIQFCNLYKFDCFGMRKEELFEECFKLSLFYSYIIVLHFKWQEYPVFHFVSTNTLFRFCINFPFVSSASQETGLLKRFHEIRITKCNANEFQ